MDYEQYWVNRIKKKHIRHMPRHFEIVRLITSIKRIGAVLDLGCGSGNIAVSIKKIYGSEVEVFSSDISLEALKIAKKNSALHGTDIAFINADLLSGFKRNSFELIVSNPPYVQSTLIEGSLRHEPRIALEADRDGLKFIKKILLTARSYLKNKGFIIIEIGYNQKEAVAKFVERLGFYEIKEWIKDYSGHWRGIILKRR